MACDNACKLKIILCSGGVVGPLNQVIAMAPLITKLSDTDAAEIIAEIEEMEERAERLLSRVERAVK